MTETTQLLVWQDDFATGVEQIDEQHKILIHSLQEANEQLAINSSAEVLDKITRDLLAYALYHFETEEELMEQYGYGAQEQAEEREAHLAQHRSFAAKVLSIREALKAGTLISREELLGFLTDWLKNHILHTDKKLGRHVSARQADASAPPA